MKIGIDARMYDRRQTTGIGVYIQNLLQALWRIDQDNDYIVFLLPDSYADFVCPNPRVKKIKVTSHWYGWSEQLIFPLILHRYRLDLVHFPHFNVPLFYGGRFIVTIHDIIPHFFPGPRVNRSSIRRWGYQTVFRQAVRRARTIITVSQTTKNYLRTTFRVPPEKVTVIYPGFNQTPITAVTDPAAVLASRFGVTKPFLFFVGVWRDHKNLPGLVAAFNQLRQRYHRDIQLVLGGTADPRYPEIQAAINQSPFRADIITPGYVADADLPYFYRAAAAFILPSFFEGFGLVAFEALAYGTPCVGSQTTPLPELLGTGGLYFDPYDPTDMADKINAVLTDPTVRQSVIIAGQGAIGQLSWQRCARQTLAVYQSERD